MTDTTLQAHDATIHDLGYRRYEGEMQGASGAWRALYWQGFRAMFGIGRSMKAKVVPIFVVVVTLLPALAMLTAANASGGAVPLRYARLLAMSFLLHLLFAAAQIPELFSRDQQDRLLPLVLTRQITRRAYATARFAAVLTAMFFIVVGPLLLLYSGEIGSATDPGAQFQKMGHKIAPIFIVASSTSFLFSAIGSALSAWTPRRTFATAGIIGAFLVLSAISAGLEELAGMSPRLVELVDPVRSLAMLAHIAFEETTRAMELQSPPSMMSYLGYLGALGTAGLLLLWIRVQRVRV